MTYAEDFFPPKPSLTENGKAAAVVGERMAGVISPTVAAEKLAQIRAGIDTANTPSVTPAEGAKGAAIAKILTGVGTSMNLLSIANGVTGSTPLCKGEQTPLTYGCRAPDYDATSGAR